MGTLQSFLFEYDVDSEADNADPAQPVRLVRALLASLGLPAELVLEIMDFADYYPAVRGERTDLVRMLADQYYRPPDPDSSALLYLVSPPLPAGRDGEGWRMKSVTWTVEGHDQGWGGELPGTFTGAYSWYEACIFRPCRAPGCDAEGAGDVDGTELDYLAKHSALYYASADIQEKLVEVGWTLVPVPKPDVDVDGGASSDAPEFVWRVQSNRVATRVFQRHVVEWGPGTTARRRPAAAGSAEAEGEEEEDGSGDGVGFVDALRPGDRVGLWMRAKYPGWQNHIKLAGVELVYDVR